MGYETGLAILTVSSALRKRDLASAIHQLKELQVNGPRGKRNFWVDNKEKKPDIAIEKITAQPFNNKKLVIEQEKAINHNHTVFEEIHNGSISGWQNPYLCV